MEETVKDAIEAARLKESELLPIAQKLYMCNKTRSDLKLMQLSPDFIDKLSEGQVLSVKGDNDEPVVLCTESATFDLKEAETSNSLLILQNLVWPENLTDCDKSLENNVVTQEITGIFHKYLTIRPCPPKLGKLTHLLESNPYQGKEYEDNDKIKYTFVDLVSRVQASKAEIKEALKQMQACTIDGYVRILDFNYKFRVFSQIIRVIESKSLPLNKVPKESVLKELEDLESKEILDLCFSSYAYDTGVVDDNGNSLFALKEDDICQFYAEVLLKPAGKFNLQEFLESWQKSIPEGMTSKLSQLEGIAVTDLTCKPEVIFYFPVHELSENVNDRFIKLFKTKKKWSYEEIYPYVRNVANSDHHVRILLTKYSRSSVVNGVKMYSSKW